MFRITLAERQKIEDFQRRHPIYRVLPGREGARLGLDHNHKSGLVRGCLQWQLNRMYGLAENCFPENCAEVFEALAVYHRQHPAELALGKKVYGLVGRATTKKKKLVYGPV